MAKFRRRTQTFELTVINLHSILPKQDIHYKIYVVEQSNTGLFNRAKLINIGVIEALKEFAWGCVIVQDVDYVLLDSTRSYNLCDFRCNGSDPSVYLNAVNVGGLKPHPDFLSGSVTIPVDTFKRVNGYSNDYWGWGGEDDDFRVRVKTVAKIKRRDSKVCKFKELSHEKKRERSDGGNGDRYIAFGFCFKQTFFEFLDLLVYSRKRSCFYVTSCDSQLCLIKHSV